MRMRLLDLDGSVASQPGLARRWERELIDLREWGPRIRLSCAFRSFRCFEAALGAQIEEERADRPELTFLGSGDFHHVSLALVRLLRTPFNLLVLDKHPDWMRRIPVLHCGNWLYHAARLPQVRRIFHVGGDLDFDNAYRWLAPWSDLAAGKIKVLPALRRFKKGKWAGIVHRPLRLQPDVAANVNRVRDLLEDDREDLARWPLYISLDKDVMTASDAIVNWDSGYLAMSEVESVLQAFLEASGGNVVGMDVVGDWSPVRVRGLYRRFLHWSEHPPLTVNAAEAAAINERSNLRLAEFLDSRIRFPSNPIAHTSNGASPSGKVA